jgi:GNAT superfamily N-acetyltransferase
LKPVDSRERAKAFLESDRLGHLAHLKYLYLYGNRIDCFYSEYADSTGLLLSHPVTLMGWDAAVYPDADAVLLPVASDEAAAEALLNHTLSQFKPSAKLVLKFCDSWTRQLFAQAFVLHSTKTMISFTTDRFQAPVSLLDNVIVSDHFDEAQAALHFRNGYSQDELEQYFADGALSFTIYEGKQAVCSCLVYLNFDTVWEIGALHTLENARRKGYARQAVSAALVRVLADGYIPRYVAENHNMASIRLAESLGMRPCLHLEHCLTWLP